MLVAGPTVSDTRLAHGPTPDQHADRGADGGAFRAKRRRCSLAPRCAPVASTAINQAIRNAGEVIMVDRSWAAALAIAVAFAAALTNGVARAEEVTDPDW